MKGTAAVGVVPRPPHCLQASPPPTCAYISGGRGERFVSQLNRSGWETKSPRRTPENWRNEAKRKPTKDGPKSSSDPYISVGYHPT